MKENDNKPQKSRFHVIVNAREKEVTQPSLSFDEVARLAYAQPPFGANTLYTITYRKGPPENKEGTLIEGQSVSVKNEMIFNVTATDKS